MTGQESYTPYLSRMKNKDATLLIKNFSSGAYGHNEFHVLHCPGRETIDMLTSVRRSNNNLSQYKLNSVCKHFGIGKKEDMSYERLFEILAKKDTARHEMFLVCSYCAQDSALPLLLMDKLCVITNSLEMMKSTRVPMDWLLTRGQQCKVFSQLVYEARKRNYIIPVREFQKKENNENNEKKSKYKGATVLTALKGLYQEPVSGLDFKSLYPSIMIAYNMCFSTIVLDKRYMNLDGIKYEHIELENTDEITGEKTIRKITFVQASNDTYKGILSDILDRLWKERNLTKKEMKKHYGTFMYKVLDGKQLAIKVTMNSVYGFTGAERGMLPCKDIAAAVTSKGRQMIELTSTLAETFYQCLTTYGDSVPYMQKVLVSINGEIKRIPIGLLYDKFALLKYNLPVVTYQTKGYNKRQLLTGCIKLKCWSNNGWTQVRRVIRHTNLRKIYLVRTDKGDVKVTECHSLFTPKGKEIKPTQLNIGDKILWKQPNLNLN